jgi:hypothetical protein
VGAQIAEAQACTEDLLNSMARAAGLPSKGIQAGITWVGSGGRPDPTREPQTGSDGGACLGESDAGPGEPGECSAMLCEDGFAAEALSGGCSCGAARFDWTPLRDFCLAQRCADGQMPASDCSCARGGDLPPAPPGPGPEIFSRF